MGNTPLDGSRLVAYVLALGLSGCGDGASPPPPGIYHLETLPFTLAMNVEIDPGGSFRWGGGGCDSFFDSGGQWQAVGDRLLLMPIGDDEKFVWAVSLTEEEVLTGDAFERLEIVAGELEGELIASGIGERWGDYSAIFLAGGMCSTGCLTATAPCENPYLGASE